MRDGYNKRNLERCHVCTDPDTAAEAECCSLKYWLAENISVIVIYETMNSKRKQNSQSFKNIQFPIIGRKCEYLRQG